MMNSFKKIIPIICLLITSCSVENNFPEIYVNESIPITMAQYSNVYNNIWGYEYVSGGLGGIIIVQGLNNEFIAYDRSCTQEINGKCVVSGKSVNDPVLHCSNCCNSKFVEIDASATAGPANLALKKYNTHFDGTMLYITN